MRVYIAGPMSGIPEYNFPAFDAAAADWRAEGWEVVNPAEMDREADGFNPKTDAAKPIQHYMRRDITALLTVDAIAFLPGWERSVGCGIEKVVAEALGLEMFDAMTFAGLKPESILAEAERLVGGTRQKDYGHPIEDFTRTGKMWGAILGADAVSPDNVALMMVALKISRECNAPKRDNRVDGCGYFKTLDMVRERQG